MTPEDKQAEREHTDESLRAEREKADHALGALEDQTSAIDETADAVITKARIRADEVLAAARARADRQTRSPDAPPPSMVERKRASEDRAVEEERAHADRTLLAERADQVATLSAEREETDKDLLTERERSDDAVATRDDFLGIVSHDLRNMLHSVMGFAALITKGVNENNLEQVPLYADRIQRSGARMTRLIGDLVDVASIEAGMLAVTREVGDPSAVVTEAVDTFQPQAAACQVTLVAELMARPSLAAFDPARILQVLTNLLSNAIKFTPPGGKVVVRVERVADELRFAVSDTGPGIPADQLETVFERFRQATKNDRRGVGLGLYIAKCIVQGHGGRIWAESKLGAGSTFMFTLPAHTA